MSELCLSCHPRLKRLTMVAVVGLMGAGIGYGLSYLLGCSTGCAPGRSPFELSILFGAVAVFGAISGSAPKR